jgi:hypothetical protein
MESEAIARRYYSRQFGAKPTLQTADEVHSGHFSGGGLALNFNDGRTSRTKLYIRVLDVSRVIVKINHLFGPPV